MEFVSESYGGRKAIKEDEVADEVRPTTRRMVKFASGRSSIRFSVIREASSDMA